MAKARRHILVAVRDLHHPPLKVLRKAGALARGLGASLELFHAITLPNPGRSYPETLTARGADEQAQSAVATAQERLARMGRHPTLRDVTVRCSANWDFPPHEAIIRRARASRATLILAATHLRERLMLRNTDWELIRHCPTPLLLVKSPRPYRRPVVLAAVDPFHAGARPADLDRKLLQAGAEVAQSLHGRLHLFHAAAPLLTAAPFLPEAAPLGLSPAVQRMHDEVIAKGLQRLAQRVGIPAARRHVALGDVSDALPRISRRLRASIVIMGAISRSALKRLFIGNSAERVLDEIGCDVLVIKPRGFLSRVPPREAR
jgi:universal stress protein E